jgi:hypothetical protein
VTRCSHPNTHEVPLCPELAAVGALALEADLGVGVVTIIGRRRGGDHRVVGVMGIFLLVVPRLPPDGRGKRGRLDVQLMCLWRCHDVVVSGFDLEVVSGEGDRR